MHIYTRGPLRIIWHFLHLRCCSPEPADKPLPLNTTSLLQLLANDSKDSWPLSSEGEVVTPSQLHSMYQIREKHYFDWCLKRGGSHDASAGSLLVLVMAEIRTNSATTRSKAVQGSSCFGSGSNHPSRLLMLTCSSLSYASSGF